MITPDEVGARHLPGLGIIHKHDDLHILSASNSNLAQLFQDQGRLATAEPLMQEDLRDNREELTTRTVHRALLPEDRDVWLFIRGIGGWPPCI